jgi:hypothetical protein
MYTNAKLTNDYIIKLKNKTQVNNMIYELQEALSTLSSKYSISALPWEIIACRIMIKERSRPRKLNPGTALVF